MLVLDGLNSLDLLHQWGEPGATRDAGHKETGRIETGSGPQLYRRSKRGARTRLALKGV